MSTNDDRYRNPDNDPRGPYMVVDATIGYTRPNLIFEWHGHLPPQGRSWRYTRETVEQLEREGRVSLSANGRPRIKRYLADIREQLINTAPMQALTLQTAVTVGPRTNEGSVIVAIRPAWQAVVELLREDPSQMHSIDARRWEELIAAAYHEAGFDRVILTPRSGDLGRDIIAIKNGYWSVRIIDQVKAYAPGRPVPANDVRALLGVLQADRNATKGIVTTTSFFAPRIEVDPFIAPFLPHRLELVDGTQLIRRLCDIAGGVTS